MPPRGWAPTVSLAAPAVTAPIAASPARGMDLRDAVLEAVSAPADDLSEATSEPTVVAPSAALETNAAAPDPHVQSSPDSTETRSRESGRTESELATAPASEASDSATEPEPDSNAAGHATSSSPSVDSQWPAPRGARLRAAFAPLLVSVATGLLAFLAIRIFAVGASRPPRLPAPAPAAEPKPVPTVVAGPRAFTADAGAALQPQPTTATAAPAPELEFTSELLELPPRTKLPAGQGLLEVRAGQRQQIYVDGAFLGNYENRVIALQPGSYQLRLSLAGRDAEQTVEVKAGRRTRISARTKTSP